MLSEEIYDHSNVILELFMAEQIISFKDVESVEVKHDFCSRVHYFNFEYKSVFFSSL